MRMEELSQIATRTDRWMVHALCDRQDAEASTPNLYALIAGRVQLFYAGDFALMATYSGGNHASEDLLEQQIAKHSHLVNELHRILDILPFRFGVIMSSDQISHTVRLNRDFYRSCLDRIEGMTELNLRWAVAEGRDDQAERPNPASNSSSKRGYEYLTSKLIHRQLGGRLEDELKRCCEDFCNRFPSEKIKWQSSISRLKVRGHSDGGDCYWIARLELLVRKEEAANILNAATSLFLRSEKPTVASGPWPPYSFIESENVISQSHPMQRCAITPFKEAVS